MLNKEESRIANLENLQLLEIAKDSKIEKWLWGTWRREKANVSLHNFLLKSQRN